MLGGMASISVLFCVLICNLSFNPYKLFIAITHRRDLSFWDISSPNRPGSGCMKQLAQYHG